MELNGKPMTLTEIATVALGDAPVKISSSARPGVIASRRVIEDIVAHDDTVYGVSTGFGKLSDVRIPHDALAELQLNLVRSHGCGIGNPLSEPEARAMMLLRANVLALGLSGVRCEVIELLCEMLNRRIYPVVPEKGSVGASGDLAPLAHLGLTLIGEGEAFFDGHLYTGTEALQQANLEPLHLHAKEGLALINGTHLMEAIAVLTLADAEVLLRTAEVACAMSIEGLMGSHVPFDARISKRRGQQGQQVSAARLRHMLREI